MEVTYTMADDSTYVETITAVISVDLCPCALMAFGSGSSKAIVAEVDVAQQVTVNLATTGFNDGGYFYTNC